jgi:hypothetical protein
LSEVEKDMVSHVPEVGHNLLANVPRLESVARIVLYQDKRYDGSGFPGDSIAGARIPLGARMLKVLTDLDQVESDRIPRAKALEILKKRAGWYDPVVLDAAFLCFASRVKPDRSAGSTVRAVTLKDLEVGQILLSDVVTRNGALLITAGNWVSETILGRIRNFAKLNGIREPIRVQVEGVPDVEPVSDALSLKEVQL